MSTFHPPPRPTPPPPPEPFNVLLLMTIEIGFTFPSSKISFPQSACRRTSTTMYAAVRSLIPIASVMYTFQYWLLLLLACAITHHSYVQSIVLEPCSRLIVQNNEAIDPLRWSVDGATPTGSWLQYTLLL